MDAYTAKSETDAPRQADLDRCVHCGLCLNACPTYRELGVEMDSPRGRIYQMVQVAGGAPITDEYREHIGLCLACRGCETACPSGVPYGRLVEAARAEIQTAFPPRGISGRIANFVFGRVLPSPGLLTAAGAMLYMYQVSGLQRLVRGTGILRPFGSLADREALLPQAEIPFFYRHLGEVLPALGERRFRVAFLSGCIANIAFARLNEATVRVLRRNGCEVTIPAAQTCCGALHVHAGRREEARVLARKNVAAIDPDAFDAIITNAAGCGSTLKEYHELLENDERADAFRRKVRDVTEFLAANGVVAPEARMEITVTLQDSCHLAHGQKIRRAPRQVLQAIPGLTLREMPMADLCCGSAGIYNVLHTGLSMKLLRKKMQTVEKVEADIIATANPGCMLQLEAGVRKWGQGERVAHIVELLDEAYEKAGAYEKAAPLGGKS